jgi:KDO2-lipid IV(A) lauroyltransferase
MHNILKIFLWLLSLISAGMPYGLARKGAGLWMRFSPVKRHTAERNLERCYPEMPGEEREGLVKESFVHYLAMVLETGHNWYWSKDRLRARCIEFRGGHLLEEAMASDRGVVILVPHFGAWEYLWMYLTKFQNIAALYKPPSNPELEKALLERRSRDGAIMIAATGAGIRKLYTHVKSGGAAGILPDQLPSRGQGQFAPFFGNQALTGVLVPRLVQRTGCRVLASAAERLPGGDYRVHIMPVSDDIHSEDIDLSLAAVNRAVEDCIAIDPAQYLWSYRRFKRQPEGSPPFYDFR